MPTTSLSALTANFEGEILCDETSRMLFSSDASLYQQHPLGVAYPKSIQDLYTLLTFANEHRTALIPRAAGTSLAGQVVGPHLIVDTSRYLNNILHIDIENLNARVQPGVIPAQVNQQLRPHRLMFAPDPSTLNRCTIGGMIGNNAWGAHCLRYGATREHILSLSALLGNGDEILCQPLTHQQLTQIQSQNSHEANLYRELVSLIEQHRDTILARYPAPSSVPCNTGYALHLLSSMQPWNVSGEPFNLSTLICGSEGTLAFVTEATIKLTPVPQHNYMLCPHFETLSQALQAVALAKNFQPAAIELLDQYLLRLTRNNLQQQRNRAWINNDPAAILLIEFSGDNAAELLNQAHQLTDQLRQTYGDIDIPLLRDMETQTAWSIRRASLGLLMGVTSKRKPVTFIEDSAVPVAALPEFVRRIQELMSRLSTDCVYYGSVSMGLIHLRPLLDMTDPSDVELMKTIAHEVALLIKTFHGAMSAKHGDGIVRGPFIRELLGDDVVTLLAETKHLFDPLGLLNPGKIVQPQPIDQHLRLIRPPSSQASTFFKWQNDGGFFHTIDKCNGAGACRKGSGNGTMCPSYMVTHNELDTTRGRANIFRQLIQQYGFQQAMAHTALQSALNHCLSCKACQSECPANVDMAKMKAEFLHQRSLRGIRSRQQILIRHFDSLNRIASIWPNLSNRLLDKPMVKSLLGIASPRSLPRYAHHTFSQWFNQRTHPTTSSKQQPNVILLCDPFTQYFDVEAGIAATGFLEQLGYHIILSPCFGSPRSLISQGLLPQAQHCLETMIAWFSQYTDNALPIIGIEPSELLTLRDEALDFPFSNTMTEQIRTIAKHSYLFDEFIAQKADAINAMNLPWRREKQYVYVHGHCHQKSLSGIQPLLTTLSLVPELCITEIPSGCCGMAGLFGYEAEHYAMSMQIAELELFPAIRNAEDNAVIVATGTSCRQQIAHGLHCTALHTAQVLYNALDR